MALRPLERIDVEHVVASLAGQSGLGLNIVEPMDSRMGGWAIAPARPPAGYEFELTLFSTSRRAEAQFLPDKFSGPLVRQVGEAVQHDASAWRGLLEDAGRDAVQVNLFVNDGPFDPLAAEDPPLDWRNLEIIADRSFDGGEADRSLARRSALEAVAWTGLALLVAGLVLENVSGDAEILEGDVSHYVATRYERNHVNRMRCIRHFGWTCQICGFDFRERYGDLGAEFIEVHHLVPVSTMDGPTLVDPQNDLLPVCSNCHRMIHRGGGTLTASEVRDALERAAGIGRASERPSIIYGDSC